MIDLPLLLSMRRTMISAIVVSSTRDTFSAPFLAMSVFQIQYGLRLIDTQVCRRGKPWVPRMGATFRIVASRVSPSLIGATFRIVEFSARA